MWNHPKHKVVGAYRSYYQYLYPEKKQQRMFILTGLKKDGTVDTKVFESAHAAKKMGWVKV